MAVSTVHVLHGIYNTALISQIQNARVVSDIQQLVAESAGFPYPLFTANLGQNPAIPFDTTQVKTILDTTGALASIADLSGANTDLYFKKVTDLGRRLADATSGHLRFRMSQAFMVLDRITAGHRSEAVASCRIGCTYDGTNAPLVPAGSIALTGTPSSAEHFVAGPVQINVGAGLVTIPGIQEITIDFNRRVLEAGGDGELYNTFAALMSYSPVVTIRTLENVWATYGLNGSEITAGNFWLRKVDVTSRVANATAEHILFQNTTGGHLVVEESSGGGNDESMTTARITLVGDATTEPITVDTTAAIS